MMDENCNLNTINHSALEMLDRLKHLEPDDRFTLLEEYGWWWFNKVDLTEELFVPDWKKLKEQKISKYY